MQAFVFFAAIALALYLWVLCRPLHGLVNFSASLGSVSNSDTAFVNDGIFGFRNNHWFLTDRWNIIAAHVMGSTLGRARLNSPQLAQYLLPHLWPIGTLATIETPLNIMDFRGHPWVMPMNEEITAESSTTGAGPARVEGVLFVAAPNFTANQRSYRFTGLLRGTSTIVAGAEGAWTADADITFERDPLGGVYDILGAEVVAANAVAFRLRLPDMLSVNAKVLRPGGLVQDTAANVPWPPQRGEQGGLGVWGSFYTTNKPQLSVFGDAAGGTYEVRLYVGYVGPDQALVYSVPGLGMSQ